MNRLFVITLLSMALIACGVNDDEDVQSSASLTEEKVLEIPPTPTTVPLSTPTPVSPSVPTPTPTPTPAPALRVEEPLYTSNYDTQVDRKVISDSSYRDYIHYTDVETLRIFKLPDVSDDFLLKVSEMIQLMFLENEKTDNNLRNDFFNTLKDEYVFQRVGYMGPESYNLDSEYPTIDCCPGKNYDNNHTDFIWETGDPNSQLGEVIEHALHTITNVGFKLMSEEWDYLNPDSKLRKAYQEAVEKDLFNEESYLDLKQRGDEDFRSITTQEFFFWVIITEWDLGYLWQIPHDEFSVSNKQDLIARLPLSHALYVDFVEKILNPPNNELLIAINEQ